ncbi:hypothetical protein [Nostoc sp. CCY 9925]|uniref:hypothetical protein n=1 Tax=Nostoc sp. CCY 9925 TaxID=3103865 RepID=UPI0039C5DF9C
MTNTVGRGAQLVVRPCNLLYVLQRLLELCNVVQAIAIFQCLRRTIGEENIVFTIVISYNQKLSNFI